ncbi:DUF2513 domain-containing protein [Adhaeretor mobilis]|uniref:DUF2513 domain-containing protein n=1 Tax=Adhaeretor mobilis TaxID=1930276 RepID=A0A517MSY5_9BACT|nr:DUF2513 domain-containing protein [Adhaeretor mobilis]QDS98005.1 hypothetical protein HG15A2_12750 [Adhaeretor mobilis]
MKRDIDLARELLLDIENRGIDCSMSVLRSGPNQENEERIRYHLRLLIDAGLLKEVDRTSTGIPCLRLTHDGHELLELARNEGRWRQAKSACQQRIGGLSLSVIRQLLIRSALRPRYGRRFRPFVAEGRYEVDRYREFDHYRPQNHYRTRPAYRAEPYRYETIRDENAVYGPGSYAPMEGEDMIDTRAADARDWWTDGVDQGEPRYAEPRCVRTRFAGYEMNGRDSYQRNGIDLDGDGRIDLEFETTLPDYLI